MMEDQTNEGDNPTEEDALDDGELEPGEENEDITEPQQDEQPPATDAPVWRTMEDKPFCQKVDPLVQEFAFLAYSEVIRAFEDGLNPRLIHWDFSHRNTVAEYCAHEAYDAALKDIDAYCEKHPEKRPPMRMSPEEEAAEAAPLAEPVEVRGHSFIPAARSQRYDPKPIPRLDISRAGQELANASNAETHALLNGLIGECHFYMREVVFRSICNATDHADRVDWVNSAMRLAETGAKVADSVGRLRNGPQITQTAHRMTVEKVVTSAGVPTQGGGG
jgi:hypothetical protein